MTAIGQELKVVQVQLTAAKEERASVLSNLQEEKQNLKRQFAVKTQQMELAAGEKIKALQVAIDASYTDVLRCLREKFATAELRH
jgi:hypothetical protein